MLPKMVCEVLSLCNVGNTVSLTQCMVSCEELQYYGIIKARPLKGHSCKTSDPGLLLLSAALMNRDSGGKAATTVNESVQHHPEENVHMNRNRLQETHKERPF